MGCLAHGLTYYCSLVVVSYGIKHLFSCCLPWLPNPFQLFMVLVLFMAAPIIFGIGGCCIGKLGIEYLPLDWFSSLETLPKWST